MRHLYFSLAALFATASFATTASAQTKCDAQSVKAANARTDEAVKLYGANPPKYEAALVALNQAYGACASPKVMRNIVVVELKLGRTNPKSMVSAARHAHFLTVLDPEWSNSPRGSPGCRNG